MQEGSGKKTKEMARMPCRQLPYGGKCHSQFLIVFTSDIYFNQYWIYIGYPWVIMSSRSSQGSTCSCATLDGVVDTCRRAVIAAESPTLGLIALESTTSSQH